uniref:PH01B035L11.5 protein n=1 Tax=Phyllostachys edulis TaxID=38705 RepID=L0P231_PHYED|nr:PH01B035L11.5 [Phyllostachys edulis]
MVTLKSAPSINFLRKCPRTPTSTPRLVHGQASAVFAPTGSYLDPAPPLTVVLDAGGIIIIDALANPQLVVVVQQDTIPAGADSSNPTSTPSGAVVNSIDLGDEHVPKLFSCQLGACKVFDKMLGADGISYGFSTSDLVLTNFLP